MSALPACLYCQHPNPPGQEECRQCGMPLPAQTERARQRRLRRFQWFCLGLTLFCLAMFFSLPRDIG